MRLVLLRVAAYRSKGVLHLLPVRRGFVNELQSVLITFAPTNSSFQPHHSGSTGQPKFQFKSVSDLQVPGNDCFDAIATEVKDPRRDSAALIL